MLGINYFRNAKQSSDNGFTIFINVVLNETRILENR